MDVNVDDVDVGTLSRSFDNTTNSYKYIFFISLLELILEGNFKKTHFSFTDIIIRMVRVGWYPHTYYHLSFGVQDKMGAIIDGLELSKDDIASPKALNEKMLFGSTGNITTLLRYVPYRFIVPFLADKLKVLEKGETRSQVESLKNKRIKALSDEYFDTIRPLYRLAAKDSVEIHPAWMHYIHHNYTMVEGWVQLKWVRYLQERNKSVPAIVKKVNVPLTRNLQAQRKWWQVLLNDDEYRCIYTNEVIDSSDYALDHYLPWSFVGHDQLWNLVPVSKAVNSSKSDNIPNEKFLKSLVSLQGRALQHSYALTSQQKWQSGVQGYVLDLNIGKVEQLLEEKMLRSAYQVTVPPLIQIASNIGFSMGWEP